MSIFSLPLVLVILARLCAGAVRHVPPPNLKERTNQIANIMLDELIRRATNGFKPTVAVSRNPVLPSTSFSKNGYFYLTSSVEADCSKPLLDFGVPVDACIWTESFSFKLQIHLGSADLCEGSVVEYYLDETCTIYAGTSPVETVDTVCKNTGSPFATGVVHSQLHCTTTQETLNRQYGCAYYMSNFVCDDPTQYKYALLRSNDARCMGPYHAPNTVPHSLEYYTQVTSCTEEECPLVAPPVPVPWPSVAPNALPTMQPC